MLNFTDDIRINNLFSTHYEDQASRTTGLRSLCPNVWNCSSGKTDKDFYLWVIHWKEIIVVARVCKQAEARKARQPQGSSSSMHAMQQRTSQFIPCRSDSSPHSSPGLESPQAAFVGESKKGCKCSEISRQIRVIEFAILIEQESLALWSCRFSLHRIETNSSRTLLLLSMQSIPSPQSSDTYANTVSIHIPTTNSSIKFITRTQNTSSTSLETDQTPMLPIHHQSTPPPKESQDHHTLSHHPFSYFFIKQAIWNTSTSPSNQTSVVVVQHSLIALTTTLPAGKVTLAARNPQHRLQKRKISLQG